jgi:predicted O-linked N-acetylglucosamine transferase (SPINDLY family)
LPVLTCAGNKFAGRVAGNLLNAVGLPELVTGALEEYEELALSLARDPERLQDLEEKLARNRLTAPLFNSARHTRDLECAFQEMVRLYRNGAAPRNISVADIS